MTERVVVALPHAGWSKYYDRLAAAKGQVGYFTSHQSLDTDYFVFDDRTSAVLFKLTWGGVL